MNSSLSARAGMKSSFVSIFIASASGWSSPRIRMRKPKMEARLAPMRSCMMADCLRSTQVRSPPKLSTTNMTNADRDRLQQEIQASAAHAFTT